MVKRFLILTVPLFMPLLSNAPASGAENADRARAVLAVAKAKGAGLGATPEATPKDYPAGYKAATVAQRPLVVFVGCDVVPVNGAIACKCDADSFGDAKAPAVVVGYPAGDRLMLEATLTGRPVPDTVRKAVAAAAKKIDAPAPRPMPEPKALDGPPRRTSAGCPCGGSCPCASGACPSVCPPAKLVAEARVAPPGVAYREVWHTDGKRTWRELVPDPSFTGCPNGRCPSTR